MQSGRRQEEEAPCSRRGFLEEAAFELGYRSEGRGQGWVHCRYNSSISEARQADERPRPF